MVWAFWVNIGTSASFQKKAKTQIKKESRNIGNEIRRRLKPLERMAVISCVRDNIPKVKNVEKRAAKANTRESKRGIL